MSAGRVYEIAEAQRAALLRGERAAASELVNVYGGIWQRIRVEIDALLAEMATAQEAGKSIPIDWLLKRDRLTALPAQVEAELRVFAEFADPLITRAQGNAVDMALAHAETLTRAATRQMGLSINWQRLPVEALRSLVGFTGDGAPVRALLDRLGPAAGARIRDSLLQGVALGWHPERIATTLRDDFAGGLTQALTTSRTEIMRAYREGTSAAYQENDDVLTGWIWNAACTPRTCAMCWAMHGSVHPFTERLDDHPNGRCVALPAVKQISGLRPQWLPETGVSQFAKLPPDTQRNILGPLYEPYASGQIGLADVVGRKYDPEWGSMRFVRTKQSVLGAA